MLDYIADGQTTIFDMLYPTFKIDKPIRLIELFAGVGSQAMALRDLGASFEHYRIAEWEVSAFKSYKAIHMLGDNTDYSKDISKDDLPQILFNYGISTNGKDPMSLKEIQRKGEKWQRETYNNIKATNNLCSVCNFKGEDLGIVETDKYCYILTYSFPCQDLSVAGKMQGMAKGSGTRSGLLWEVERLLNEVKELPQVLLMENVPQVISDANIADFHKWQDFLIEKGYTNYAEVLNAKDFGVAQNRERCFMVSLLGQWNYKFPKPIPLTKTMKDYLEDEVNEKYYINSEKANKLIQQLMESGQLQKTQEVSYCLDANYHKGTTVEDFINKHRRQLVCTDLSINNPKVTDISNCITARQDRGISNHQGVGGAVAEQIKQIGNYETESTWDNPQTGRVYSADGISPTFNTCSGGDRQPKIVEAIIVRSTGRNPDNPSDRTPGNHVEQRLEPNSQGICNTLTSVQKDNLVLEPRLVGGLGEKDWGKQWRQGNRVYDSNAIAMALNASPVGNAGGYSYLYKTGYRIRKLTPKECWRLMDFTDEDFYKAEKVNSNTQLYKQAGNGIVKAVLMAIFKQMLVSK